MMKKLVIAATTSLTIIAGTAGFMFVKASPGEMELPNGEKRTNERIEEMLQDKQEIAEIKLAGEEEFKSMLDLEFKENDSEEKLIKIIHMMSHQKIEAANKWGGVPMTETTISQVKNFLNNHGTDFDHYDKYIEIINKWEKGNFEESVEDHNFVWELEGGINGYGEAFGLLDNFDESIYIKESFGEPFYDYLVEIGEFVKE